MKRRDFIKIMGAGALINPIATFPLFAGERKLEFGKQYSFRLTYQINLPANGKRARLWLPLPNTMTDDYQYTQGSNWSGTAGKAQFESLGNEKFPIFTAEWQGEGEREVLIQSIIKTSHHTVDLDFYRAQGDAVPANIRPYLQASRLIQVDGLVKDVAYSIVYDEGQSPLEKVRAIYDWLIDNFRHDETMRGRGKGDVKAMLEGSRLSGKCVDVHSLFVALVRSVGIPARIQYGIRMMESDLHPELGRLTDVTTSQHSRAEFYLDQYGWIPVNPADVCKVIKLTGLELDDPVIEHLREKFFGTWEMNWITFNHAQDVQLPNSSAGKLPFFLFPHAEIDNQPLDSLNPAEFKYAIRAAELVGTGAKF